MIALTQEPPDADDSATAPEASTMIDDSLDPVYRIAYDVSHCKVGCVLLQATLCGTVPHDLFNDYFGDSAGWTVNTAGCQVYSIRKSQLPSLAARTNFNHGH